MVRVMSVALLLAAVSASASPAIPSFEFAASQLQSSIAAMRVSQVQTKAENIGPQIQNLAWDLENSEHYLSRLRNNLRWLLQRMNRNRPGNDRSLRWDVQRFTQNLAQLTRDSQWRLDDLRFLTAQAEKDETLVAPATLLLSAARRLQSETNWFATDARFAYFDFMRAGFTFEGMDLDRDSRDMNGHAQNLENEADRLLAKVRP